jgi:hypothetical protein
MSVLAHAVGVVATIDICDMCHQATHNLMSNYTLYVIVWCTLYGELGGGRWWTCTGGHSYSLAVGLQCWDGTCHYILHR